MDITKNLIIVSTLLLISGFYISDAFAESQNLSGNSHGNEISLEFSDGNVSGTITLEDHIINLSDVKVIERSDRLFIFDKQNGLKILSKQLSSNKYIIIVKINSEDIQTKLRFIANSESVNKNAGQRNLFDAMEQKMLEDQKKELDTMTPAELKFLAKQKAIDAALKIRDERLAKIAEEESKESDDVLDPKKILEEYRKSQARTGPELLLKEEIKEVKKVDVVVNHVDIKTFLSIPHHQEWKKVLRFTVLVTDDLGRQYHLTYKDYVGNPMPDVQISGTIKNPTNEILQTFSGTTDNSGEYLGTFFIPDQSTTRGEYGISLDAVKTFKDDATTTSSNDGIFFVFPRTSNYNNLPPIADAGLPQSEDDARADITSISSALGTVSVITGIAHTFTTGDTVNILSTTNFNVDGVTVTVTGANTFTYSDAGNAVGEFAGLVQDTVTLDGTGSSDPEGATITYLWTIINDAGTGVTLDDVTSSTPSLSAIDVLVDTDLIFGLVVNDGSLDSALDTVTITIEDSGLVP